MQEGPSPVEHLFTWGSYPTGLPSNNQPYSGNKVGTKPKHLKNKVQIREVSAQEYNNESKSHMQQK